MTTATYSYSIATATKDQHGIWRDGGVTDATPEEITACDLGDFQGAMDLPHGVEFARGTDAEGRDIVAYRTDEEAYAAGGGRAGKHG